MVGFKIGFGDLRIQGFKASGYFQGFLTGFGLEAYRFLSMDISGTSRNKSLQDYLSLLQCLFKQKQLNILLVSM
jgi:hypothetical protein